LKNQAKKFDKMYSKRAFVHWIVGLGMSEGELDCCREELAGDIKQLEELDIEVDEED